MKLYTPQKNKTGEQKKEKVYDPERLPHANKRKEHTQLKLANNLPLDFSREIFSKPGLVSIELYNS